jgi:hypothetical protein
LFVVSPANHTVTRNGTMTVTVQPNEPLSELMVLQPGATVWTTVAAAVEVVLHAIGEGQQQAALKGNCFGNYPSSRLNKISIYVQVWMQWVTWHT